MRLSEGDILNIKYGWVVRYFDYRRVWEEKNGGLEEEVISGPMDERTAKRIVLQAKCQAAEVKDGDFHEWLSFDDVIQCEVEDQCERWWASLSRKDSRRTIFSYLQGNDDWDDIDFVEKYGIEKPRRFWEHYRSAATGIYKVSCEDWEGRALESILKELGDEPGLENEIVQLQREAQLNTYPN